MFAKRKARKTFRFLSHVKKRVYPRCSTLLNLSGYLLESGSIFTQKKNKTRASMHYHYKVTDHISESLNV